MSNIIHIDFKKKTKKKAADPYEAITEHYENKYKPKKGLEKSAKYMVDYLDAKALNKTKEFEKNLRDQEKIFPGLQDYLKHQED